mmetsp:Transcript_37679/g.89513  ORF Transcript_37679/g.89513 Transcript_37679/m.89513 type:complete len:142 (-) Transcript_37679:191-616(-)
MDYGIWDIFNTPFLGPFRLWQILSLLFMVFVRLYVEWSRQSRVQASHILVKDEAECLGLKEKIERGEISFENAAEQHSLCPSGKQSGKLGTFGPGKMVPAFDRVCFDTSTKVNQVVGPVQTNFGFHLIRVDERRLGRAKRD